MKSFWKSICCLMLLIFFMCACGKDSAATEEDILKQNAAGMIEKEMADILRDNPGEYVIDGIEKAGNSVLAIVRCMPGMGQGSIYLFVLELNADSLTVIDRFTGEIPLSLGVAVYRKALPELTVIYGAVGDQIWLDLETAPEKVNFTEVQLLLADGQTESTKVKNNQAFLICLEADTSIEDVLFLSGSEILAGFSDLPVDEYTIKSIIHAARNEEGANDNAGMEEVSAENNEMDLEKERSNDSKELQTLTEEFAKVYFGRDAEKIPGFLTVPYEWDHKAVYPFDGTVTDFTIKGLD